MQTLAAGQGFSTGFWIAVMAITGFYLLSNFGPIALLVCGFIVPWIKGFIWAARNNKGILLYDKDGKWYRAFEVGDDQDWMDDHGDLMRPTYSFRRHDEDD